MDSFLSKLSALTGLLKTLSWLKIAQLVTLIFVLFLGWSTYELRENIYSYITQPRLTQHAPTTVKLSKKTTNTIVSSVNKSDLIVGIQVTIVDFQKNTRTVILTHSDDRNILEVYEAYKDKGTLDFPVFNTDVTNNKRMIDLINGEFVCSPFTDTIGSKIIPELAKHIHTVCANGIPPYYGKFLGIVSIYTKRAPLPEEQDQIRSIAKNLSSMIYDNNFK